MKNDLFSKELNSRFSNGLPADELNENFSRQVHESCFSYAETKKPSNPSLVHRSSVLMDELDVTVQDDIYFTQVMSGAIPFVDFKSYAMCYGGHQFGNWAGQLGDGRAINIAELETQGSNWKFQLKGAGPTPYSRNSDGLAVLRSSIREYLCSEAMHQLGVPTTRALSLIKTGDLVTRDILYNGNQKDEHGAVVCRVAQSFIRFGSFEIFASRKDVKNLKKLLDYTISEHFEQLGTPSKETYIAFFREVVNATKDLIIHWQRVGFVHGVMNTDNMSILGLTIDYGPYGWLEDYNPLWTPNTTDREHKRYRFGNQANVALWNLTQLANALYPLILDVAPLQNTLNEFKESYLLEYKEMMGTKLGIYQTEMIDEQFVPDLESLLTSSEIDYTIFFREISENKPMDWPRFWTRILKATYLSDEAVNGIKGEWKAWYTTYDKVVRDEMLDVKERSNRMKKVNPKYVLRNYMAQLAIDDANNGDYQLVNELYELLRYPYNEQKESEKWYAKRPEWARNKVGCSMLSCSS